MGAAPIYEREKDDGQVDHGGEARPTVTGSDSSPKCVPGRRGPLTYFPFHLPHRTIHIQYTVHCFKREGAGAASKQALIINKKFACRSEMIGSKQVLYYYPSIGKAIRVRTNEDTVSQNSNIRTEEPLQALQAAGYVPRGALGT